MIAGRHGARMPPSTNAPWLRAAMVRRLAVAADADPRTVRRYLIGCPIRGMVAERIRRAVLRNGIPVPLMDRAPTQARGEQHAVGGAP